MTRWLLPAVAVLLSCSASYPLLKRIRSHTVPRASTMPWVELGESDPPPTPPLAPVASVEDPSPLRWRQTHPSLYGVTAPPPAPVRLMAEFEPMDAVYLSWKPGVADEYHLAVIEAVLRHTRVQPILLHHGRDERAELEVRLEQRGVSLRRVWLLDATSLGPWHEPAPDHPDARAVQTIWVRDWGPAYVELPTGLGIVDARYWSDRPNDDALPTKLAQLHGLPVYRNDVKLEGGNLLTDGEGTCFLADQAELASTESGSDVTDESLQQFYGCRQVVWLSAMAGEPTGHVDMFLKVGEQDTLLVGHYLPEQDASNYFVLNENADHLRTVRGAGGRRFRVLRVPMPDNADNIYRTFLNGLVLNRLVLYPRFNSFEHLEPRVRQAYRQAFPGRTLVGIDVEELLVAGGAIHCATRARPVAGGGRH